MKNFLNFWDNAILKYCDFNINPNQELYSQLEKLKEDLVQVWFNNTNFTLDIGFYPSFSLEWKIIISLINNDDWNNYLEKIEVQDLPSLQKNINYIIKKYNL